MYKVFFNDHSLTFCSKSKTLLKDNKCQVVDIENFREFENMFSNSGFMELSDSLVVVSDDPTKMWEDFRASMHEIVAAGGVVINSKADILFINRFGRWDLPKGKVEKGEGIEHAALREVEEECGLSDLRILRQLPSKFHLYYSPYLKAPDNLVLKETYWFEMIYDGTEIPTPQTEEDIVEVRWFAKNDLNKVLLSSYPNLVELIEDYLA